MTSNSTDFSSVAAELTDFFDRVGFHADGIAAHLGSDASAAMHRGEPGALRFFLQNHDTLDAVIEAFILRDSLSYHQCETLLGEALCARAIHAGIIAEITSDAGENSYRVVVDIRPHEVDGRRYWVFSDPDTSMHRFVPAREHVVGVGPASKSLLQFSARSEVGSVLDLGTGCGIQLLGQADSAREMTATDISPRALAFAKATVTGAGLDDRVELLQGPWFEPVEGRTFDRIVANPPFVVGTGTVGHVYRDSDLDLDGASELVVSQAAQYLSPGGCAYLLASWIHQNDAAWEMRVANWLPKHGVSAWMVQRDIADPAHYIGTWLRDESIDPRSAEGQELTQRWLEHFATHDVAAVGFGYIAIQDIGERPTEVLAEELPHAFEDPLGPEVEEHFVRSEWLRRQTSADIANAKFQLRPSLARETVEIASNDQGIGFEPAVIRLTRTDGPRWSHEVDSHLASLIAGLDPDGLPLAEVVALYALAHGYDEDKLVDEAVSAIVDLVRHGMVLPAELIADDQD